MELENFYQNLQRGPILKMFEWKNEYWLFYAAFMFTWSTAMLTFIYLGHKAIRIKKEGE